MKLLMITQAVDRQHKEMGAYHSWIEEISKHVDFLTVICLEKGDFNFSQNVKVLSLGKEEGHSRFKYISNLFKYIWSERNNYDSVFVHMNQEYILLAGFFWRFFNKKILFWRNHKQGNFLTTISCFLSHEVFYTSPSSFTAKFKNSHIMPTGINISKFRSFTGVTRVPSSILSMGRVSRVKKIETFLDALIILNNNNVEFKASIVGDPDKDDPGYYDSLKFKGSYLVKSGLLEFIPSIPNSRTPEMYCSHEIFVNMTSAGSLDKSIFSAMASGTLTVVCNSFFKGVLEDNMIFKEDDSSDLANKIKNVLEMREDEKNTIINNMKKYVDDNHSLEATISSILKYA